MVRTHPQPHDADGRLGRAGGPQLSVPDGEALRALRSSLVAKTSKGFNLDSYASGERVAIHDGQPKFQLEPDVLIGKKTDAGSST